MTSPSGYTRLQIVLHWFAALLILQQYVFKDAIAAAWDAEPKAWSPLLTLWCWAMSPAGA